MKIRFFLHNGKKDGNQFRYCVSLAKTKKPVIQKLTSKYPDGFVALFSDNVYYDTFLIKNGMWTPYRNKVKQWRERANQQDPFAFVFSELNKLNKLEVNVI